jgi:hypothetical protein
MPVTPAVPYLLLGLQDVQWAVGNSRGARKLARTPHVNQKKKKSGPFWKDLGVVRNCGLIVFLKKKIVLASNYFFYFCIVLMY